MSAEEIYIDISKSCNQEIYDIILYINNGYTEAASCCIQHLYKCDIEIASEVVCMFEHKLHNNIIKR